MITGHRWKAFDYSWDRLGFLEIRQQIGFFFPPFLVNCTWTQTLGNKDGEKERGLYTISRSNTRKKILFGAQEAGEKLTHKAALETAVQSAVMTEFARWWIRQLRMIDLLIGKIISNLDFFWIFHSDTSSFSFLQHRLKPSDSHTTNHCTFR